VLSGQEAKKTLFGPGDAVILGGGTAQGIQKGNEYFVRRVVQDKYTETRSGVNPVSIHTAGSVQVVETQADVSIAVVTFSCDGVLVGDYLEPFEPAPVPAAENGDTPDYARPGRIILADDRRQQGSPGQFMVIDRGSDHGLKPGQRLTLFRTTLGGAGPVAKVGTATVFVVRPESAAIRIETSVDAVYVGDLVAVHR
jgi:hypothetical protein